MTSPLAELTSETRAALVRAFEAGRLSPPYTALSVRRYTGAAHAARIAAELSRLDALGMTAAHVTEVLRLMGSAAPGEGASLVWSGPDEGSSETRDTGVVMRELFGSAERSVLVVGFALYQGKRIFRVLAEQMESIPALAVRMCLHVERPKGSVSPEREVLADFAERFRSEQWPGARLPEVYFDPRTLALHAPGQKRVSLHAKCVVVDEVRALVTSANFTEAAQARNIEVGALLSEAAFARALVRQFDGLVGRGALLRVPGL
ncbi:MAG: DISARM system phospholipase D-like protein DrmC [Polyangiaceae bacterium]